MAYVDFSGKKYTLEEIEEMMFDSINEYADMEIAYQMFMNKIYKGEFEGSDEWISFNKASIESSRLQVLDKRDSLIEQHLYKSIKNKEQQEHFNSKIDFVNEDFIVYNEKGHPTLVLKDIDTNQDITISEHYLYGNTPNQHQLYSSISKDNLEIVIKQITNELASKIVEYRIMNIRQNRSELNYNELVYNQKKSILQADIDTLIKNRSCAILSYEIRCVTDKLKETNHLNDTTVDVEEGQTRV